jgi:hypothetical protein
VLVHEGPQHATLQLTAALCTTDTTPHRGQHHHLGSALAFPPGLSLPSAVLPVDMTMLNKMATSLFHDYIRISNTPSRRPPPSAPPPSAASPTAQPVSLEWSELAHDQVGGHHAWRHHLELRHPPRAAKPQPGGRPVLHNNNNNSTITITPETSLDPTPHHQLTSARLLPGPYSYLYNALSQCGRKTRLPTGRWREVQIRSGDVGLPHFLTSTRSRACAEATTASSDCRPSSRRHSDTTVSHTCTATHNHGTLHQLRDIGALGRSVVLRAEASNTPHIQRQAF